MNRRYSAVIEKLPAGQEPETAALQLRNDFPECLYGVHVAGHVMQQNDFPVLCVGKNPIRPLTGCHLRNPVLTAGTADEGKIHRIKQQLIDSNERRPEETGRRSGDFGDLLR